MKNQKLAPETIAASPCRLVTPASLPSTGRIRWVAHRKATVVAAVQDGVLTRGEACERYNLSLEEFASWQQAAEWSGLPGLRVNGLQAYRRPDQHKQKQQAWRCRIRDDGHCAIRTG